MAHCIIAYKLTEWNIFKSNLQHFFSKISLSNERKIYPLSASKKLTSTLRHVGSENREDITKGSVRKWWLDFSSLKMGGSV